MSDDAVKLLSGQAWREWCDRLKAVGEQILEDPFPADDLDRSEGFRAITRLLAYALKTEVEYCDPRFPQIVIYEAPHDQWGGPNPDNVYWRAAIDSAYEYRVWGNAKAVRNAIFSLQEGDMQLHQYGVFAECSLDELQVAANGDFEISISATDPGDGRNWMPLPPEARVFQVRIYQSDWEHDAIGRLQIERVGAEGLAAERLEPGDLAQRLDRAMHWIEASVPYWNQYTAAGWSRATPNVAAPVQSPPGGAESIKYGSCFWELEPGQALLVTCEAPEAQYWNFCIHSLGWLESGDFASRQVSLNGHQLHIDDDGLVRVVLAHRDPGVPNWIDIESRHRGLLVYRWVWARTAPTPNAKVVAVGDLRSRLPKSHPVVDEPTRRATLSRRRELAWRRYL